VVVGVVVAAVQMVVVMVLEVAGRGGERCRRRGRPAVRVAPPMVERTWLLPPGCRFFFW